MNGGPVVETQKTMHLTAGDNAPPMACRFTDLELGDYSEIRANIKKANGTILRRDVIPDVDDKELGYVEWQNGDLTTGIHHCEFEFTLVIDGTHFTLPSRFPLILNVRPQLG